MIWKPPFYLYAAGRGQAVDRNYYNDAGKTFGEPRVLVKRTVSGCGVVYAGGMRWLIPADSIMVIERPGNYIYCHEELNEPWCFEYVSFSFTNPGGLLPEQLRSQPVMSLAGLDDLRSQFKELVDLRIVPGYRPELIHSAMAYNFFISYLAARLELEPSVPASAEGLKRDIELNFAGSISLNELIRKYGISQEAMTRMFSAAFGISPGKYRLVMRLRLACRHLEQTRYSIKEISDLCGFSGQNYFCRIFRKYMKMSPGEFRRNPNPLMTARLMLENVGINPF